ncbi:glycosyltransferase family 2 protein [Paenibacillus sp. FSL R7-0048]|uniref:Glycosyl transferase n=1 Tax=Paenibacillus odorifer TaxID=189426 RepID=A0A1R0WXX0_9BACL|nr:glycosyltransferase family 2 protein [Paenibacillus odorifer]OMD24074.1 glycosyl transferase [Paenibacillus odorifer]OMD74702.1 glycosyl transferase [Paenibacillus odorifer]
MLTKTVSVQLVTYNSTDDIVGCLKAVLAQDYPLKCIVIVDNDSEDDTIEKLREASSFFDPMGKPLMAIFPDEKILNIDKKSSEITDLQLFVYQNLCNTGFAHAHNKAIGVTDTDYVLVLNPDLILAKDYVSRLVTRLEENPLIGSATGKLLLKADHGLVDSTGLQMNKARRAFDRGAGDPAELWTQSGTVFGVSGAAAMYSRRMIEDVSVDGEFFDADFFAYKEDVDVAWRAQLFGWQGYYDAEAIGYHERGWKTSGRSTKPMFIRRISYINRYKMIYKNESARTMLKTILVSLPYEIAAHGYMLLREPKLIVAWKSFFTQLPALKKKRKYIQTIVKERKNT